VPALPCDRPCGVVELLIVSEPALIALSGVLFFRLAVTGVPTRADGYRCSTAMGFNFHLSDFILMPAVLAGILMAFIAQYQMQWRLYREDAERPEALRLPPGDWRALLVIWYFKRHGLDPLARTFLIGIILMVGGLVILNARP
jgi:hypothetical protein